MKCLVTRTVTQQQVVDVESVGDSLEGAVWMDDNWTSQQVTYTVQQMDTESPLSLPTTSQP